MSAASLEPSPAVVELGTAAGVDAPSAALVVLTPAYSRRVEPGPPQVREPIATTSWSDSGNTTDEFTPCRVETVCHLDDERRLQLPAELQGCGALTIRVGAGAVEVIREAEPQGFTRHTDHRGRLRIPRGTLAAAGLRSGMRLAIIAASPQRWVFVDANRLVLRSRA
jgi:hypothetical protein